MQIIDDDVIFLREMEISDTPDIIKWRNSEAVRSHFIYQNDFTEESHLNWIKTNIETGRAIQYIICLKDGNAPVGSVYVRDIDRTHNKGEYGIFIGEDEARGKGIGTRAAKLMVKHCFEKENFHRLFLRVYADNIQAIRSYEKAGFEREAYLKDDVFVRGEYRDIVLMGIINKE